MEGISVKSKTTSTEDQKLLSVDVVGETSESAAVGEEKSIADQKWKGRRTRQRVASGNPFPFLRTPLKCHVRQ